MAPSSLTVRSGDHGVMDASMDVDAGLAREANSGHKGFQSTACLRTKRGSRINTPGASGHVYRMMMYRSPALPKPPTGWIAKKNIGWPATLRAFSQR